MLRLKNVICSHFQNQFENVLEICLNKIVNIAFWLLHVLNVVMRRHNPFRWTVNNLQRKSMKHHYEG